MIPELVCVVGPTASGKTKMGVAIAKAFNGEVVSVDSMQIYRGMTIGTAAPTAEEMEGVPHHMIAVADPTESWSVARFVEAADACVQDILRRGKLPVLVGGTGLYLDALVRGNDFAAGSAGTAVREALQKRIEAEGAAVLLEELRTGGVLTPTEVGTAIMETSGKISVFPKSQHRALTPADMQVETGYEGIPLTLVMDGRLQKNNLPLCGQDEVWLRMQLNRMGFKSMRDVLLCYLDTDGRMTAHPYSASPPSRARVMEHSEVKW